MRLRADQKKRIEDHLKDKKVFKKCLACESEKDMKLDSHVEYYEDSKTFTEIEGLEEFEKPSPDNFTTFYLICPDCGYKKPFKNIF